MRDGLIGLIDTPKQGSKTVKESLHDADVAWCADNGCFSDKWDEAEWWAFLQRNAQRASSCIFAVAPDVVGDAFATTRLFRKWGQRIRDLGYPVAYVAQDGLEGLRGRTISGGLTFPVPWDSFDCLFIGGSTEWKLGPVVADLIAEAKRRGKWVHAGRVNSEKRFHHFLKLGADSVDGTKLVFGPDANLPLVLAWARLNDQGAMFDGWSA